MERLRISPGGLYTLLNAELKRRRLYDCTCRMPLPFHISRPDPESANWRIGTPVPCGKACDALIVEIAAHHWPKYDLMEAIKEQPLQEQPSGEKESSGA